MRKLCSFGEAFLGLSRLALSAAFRKINQLIDELENELDHIRNRQAIVIRFKVKEA